MLININYNFNRSLPFLESFENKNKNVEIDVIKDSGFYTRPPPPIFWYTHRMAS
jgi:hypothetical protein